MKLQLSGKSFLSSGMKFLVSSAANPGEMCDQANKIELSIFETRPSMRDLGGFFT